jgi:competence protein ComEC
MGFGAQNSNDNSAIFTFSSGENTYLFTGDASHKNSSGSTAGYCGELAFINSLTIEDKQALSKITVYLAGHHGSDNSSSADLFKVINPEFIVVSVSKDNEYGHPSMDMLERAKKSTNLKSDFLVCTDDYGTIVFSEFNGKLCYASYKTDERNERMISYELLASIIYVAIVVIVFCIRPRKKAETKIIDTAQK